MKIVEKGELPEADRPWWIDAESRCMFCRTVVRLDINDKPVHVTTVVAQVTCPTCGAAINVGRPVAKRTGA